MADLALSPSRRSGRGRSASRPELALLLPLAGAALALAVWWWLTAPGAGRPELFAEFGPLPALEALGRLLRDGTLSRHVGLSLRRVAVGLAIALGVGIPLGLLMGYFPTFGRTAAVVCQFLRMISPLSWAPLAVMALGIGDRPVCFLIAMAAVWPVVLSTQSGVQQLDRQWLLLARSVGASRWQALLHVVVPAVVPEMVTGARLALGLAWVVLVPAEMLGVTSGLGYFILDARDRLAYPELMAAILTIGALGFVLDAAARALQAALRRGGEAL